MKLPDHDAKLRAFADDVLNMTDWGLQQLHGQAIRRPEITDIVEMYRAQLDGLRDEARSWTEPGQKVTVHDLVRVMHEATEVLIHVLAETRAYDPVPEIGLGAAHQAVRLLHWVTVRGRLMRVIGLYAPLTVGAVIGAATATVASRVRRG